MAVLFYRSPRPRSCISAGGAAGNTDEMLFRPESLTEFASQSPKLQPLFAVIAEMAAATREALGEERIQWLAGLPHKQLRSDCARARQSGEFLARAGAYRHWMPSWSLHAPLGQSIAAHAHIHHSYIRSVSGMIVANTGSVFYDGDRRASYLLLDDSTPSIRRVEYDAARVSSRLLPSADFLAAIGSPESSESARPQMP